MQITPITNNIYFRNFKSSKKNKVNNPFLSLSPKMQEQCIDLKVFHHHIYEYKKGLRNLVLTTEKSKHKDFIQNTLEKNNIDYVIHEINNNSINVYFGDKSCIEVIKTFNPRLNKLSPEQDFILGVLLGYDKTKQCERYMKIKKGELKLGIPEE